MSKTINSVPVGNINGTSKIPVSNGSSAAETTTVNNIMGFVIENGNLIDETEMTSALAGKQATLVSGTNIKTINGNSLLGSGNITLRTTDDRSIMITATTLQALGANVAVGPQITQPVECINKLNDKGSLVIFDNRGPLKMWPVYDRNDHINLGILITVDLTGLQPQLVSGTNIKTINGMSILGSGNLSVQPTLVSGTNIKTINNNTILGSGNIDLQTKLVSGTNIKTVNNQSLLGSGNISIGGGGTPGIDARSADEYAQENLVPDFENHTLGTHPEVAFGSGLSVGDLVVDGTSDVKGVAIRVDTDVIQPKLVSGTNIKTINNQSILGSGNITISGGGGGQDMGIRVAEKGEIGSYAEGSGVGTETGINPSDGPLIAYDKGSGLSMTTLEDGGEDIGVMLGIDGDVIQGKLVSGSNIKTVNNESLLGSGNLSVQSTLVSGTNIKTINNQSILGSGNISIGGGGGGGTDDYTALNNLPQINGHTLVGNMSTSDIGIVIPDISTKQDTLVSGTNIKTINNQSILGSGNLSVAQVQADWNQDNTGAADYIKNKPAVPAAQVQTDWNAVSGMGQILNKPTLATVATSGSYNDLTDKPTVPGQVQSDWTENDTTSSAYIQHKPSLATVATSGSYNDLTDKPTVPGQVQADWTESDTSSSAYIKHKPTLATVATSGNYNDLSGKPTIPAAPVNADWDERDEGSLSFIKNKPRLATVATSGDYSDLSNTPTIPAAQIQSDWNQTNNAQKDYIKNKPNLATVATSGSYNDLSGKPTIPAAQIQSDWNQTNSSSKDYIKNKPTVPTNTITLVFTLQDSTTITKTFYTT